MTDEERRAYRVVGRVQGVGFRWWTRATATELGLTGNVRNARDGSVEIEACGSPSALAHFEERLRAGPRSARVEQIQALEPPAGDLPAGFEIKR